MHTHELETNPNELIPEQGVKRSAGDALIVEADVDDSKRRKMDADVECNNTAMSVQDVHHVPVKSEPSDIQHGVAIKGKQDFVKEYGYETDEA